MYDLDISIGVRECQDDGTGNGKWVQISSPGNQSCADGYTKAYYCSGYSGTLPCTIRDTDENKCMGSCTWNGDYPAVCN
jgi:hypothetical protein